MNAKCHLYDILDPIPSEIKTETWFNISRKMEEKDWFGELGQRYGFVTIFRTEELIVGFFAHEGQKRGIQYDEEKNAYDASTESFEHLFFGIFPDTSQLLIQHRNIYGYKDLGLPKMREGFLTALTVLFRLEGHGVASKKVQIVPAGKSYSQEEMYRYFENNSVFQVKISNLNYAEIPKQSDPTYKLYNPREELNQITWFSVAETLKVGTKRVEFESEDETGNSKLNNGPLPKAFSRIGEIRELKAINPNGNLIIRKKEADKEISITLPSTPELNERIVEQVLANFDPDDRIQTWRDRMQRREDDQLDNSLFDL